MLHKDPPPAVILRHRYETLWYVLCALITVLAFAAAFAAFAIDNKDLQEWGFSAAESQELRDNIAMLIFVPLLPLGIWILRNMAETAIKGQSFVADEALLPELVEQVADYARALGMSETPPLYITTAGLPEPFLKTITPKPRLLVLSADMAAATGDAAGLRDYHLAREIAQLRLGYSGIWRNSLLAVPRLLQLPGNTLARAETYSADALAAQLVPEHARDFMLIAIFGKALYPKVNRERYRDRWQKSSKTNLEQAVSELPLPQERYLALDRQLNSPEPYPSDGRLF
ncbi:MAG: hypothetical protein Q4A62_05665 [Eikenella sp.]|nr:hypothetical protein [Eikenella sp.]